MIARCGQFQEDTSGERTLFSRMLPSVIGTNGLCGFRAIRAG
jgi:hypothetical protein